MRQLRFDLKLALLLMGNCSMLVWIGVDTFHSRPRDGWPGDEIGQVQDNSSDGGWVALASIVLTAFTFVWISRSRNRPILMGAIGCIAGFFAIFIVNALVLAPHYFFFYQGDGEYVEDGTFVGLVVVPIVVTLICSPILAVIGAIVGGIFRAYERITRQQPQPSNQHSQLDL